MTKYQLYGWLLLDMVLLGIVMTLIRYLEHHYDETASWIGAAVCVVTMGSGRITLHLSKHPVK